MKKIVFSLLIILLTAQSGICDLAAATEAETGAARPAHTILDLPEVTTDAFEEKVPVVSFADEEVTDAADAAVSK